MAAPEKYLVRVFGSTPYTSKAVERPLRSSSLHSSGVFILFSDMPVVWCGGRSTGDARQASRRLAPRNAPLMIENKEDNDFWTELGGNKFTRLQSFYNFKLFVINSYMENFMFNNSIICFKTFTLR